MQDPVLGVAVAAGDKKLAGKKELEKPPPVEPIAAQPAALAAVLPDIPPPEELKNEVVTDGLTPTAIKINAAHRAALEELQRKYEAAQNEKAAAAIKNHLKSTKERVADLEKAVQDYLKK